MSLNGDDKKNVNSSEEPDFSERIYRMTGDLRQIVEKRVELWMIRIAEQFTGIIAESMYRVIGVILMAVSGLLLLFALAVFVGELIGNEALGYLIVAAPFLILGLLFANKRPKSVIAKTQAQMMDQFYKNLQDKMPEDEEDPDDDSDYKDSEEETDRGSNEKS